jgi:hypothetical protein
VDAQLASEAGTPPTWDLYFSPTSPAASGGVVPIISGTQEALQQASVAATIVLNGIPQLPGVGVDHLGFLAGSVLFGQLDAQVRQAISNSGHPEYVPSYDIVNNVLTVTVYNGGLTP